MTRDYPQIAQSNPLPPNRAFWDSLPPKRGMWRSLQRDMIKAANQTGCQESKALMFTLNKDTGEVSTSKLIAANPDETHAQLQNYLVSAAAKYAQIEAPSYNPYITLS